MRNALAVHKCETCPHFHEPERGRTGMCVAHPPHPLVVGAAPRTSVLDPKAVPAGFAPLVQSFYPPVSPQHGCHEHPGWRRLTAEEECPGHVASASDPRVCGRCGTHVDGLRPPEGE